MRAGLNNAPILPEHINCQGCRVEGVKTVFCDSMCGIRQCALKKGVATCGGCLDLERCPTVGAILENNPSALKNLEGKLIMNKRKIRALKLFLYCIAIAVSIFALYTFIFVFDNGLGWKIFLIIVGIGWLISAISGFIETLSNKH